MFCWRVSAWESHFRGEEVGILAQGKPYVLTAFVCLGFFPLWLKKLEIRISLGRSAVCFNGTQMGPKTNHPLAGLGWRPSRAIKAPLCGVVTPRCCSPGPPWKGAGPTLASHYHSLCTPRRKKAPSDITEAFPGLCCAVLLPHPPLLLSRAAGFEQHRATPSPVCPPRGLGWEELASVSSVIPAALAPRSLFLALSSFPNRFPK